MAACEVRTAETTTVAMATRTVEDVILAMRQVALQITGCDCEPREIGDV